ncbi:MAG: cell division protein FtsZ, partial [Novosphingobium sp.]
GAAPVIAKAARDKGVLTVGVVTKPFLFEGTRRMRAADAGIEELQKHVDTLIVIPNQNLFLVAKAETTFKEAFGLADEVLQQGVRSITDLMVMPGLINLDFADVRSVMGEMGKAMMGTGEGSGENRALEAAERAISNPLLDGVSMQGAKGVIISIIGGDDMKLLEVDEAANHIRELVDPQANIIWGSAFNPDLQGKIRVSVVATGIEQTADMEREAAKPYNFGSSRGPVVPVSAPAPATPEPAKSEAALHLDPPTGPIETEAGAEQPVAPLAAVGTYADDELELGEFAEHDETAGAASGHYESDHSDAGALGLSEADEHPAEMAQSGHGPTDDLLGSASRLSAEDGQVSPLVARKRPLVSSDSIGAEEAKTPRLGGAGSTLFERMANLSRGGQNESEEEDEEEASDGPSISIPRFLGRQNNQ